MTAVDARVAAARIVGRVLREGAYSNVVAVVETNRLNPSDRGVAHALALDTIRGLNGIDEIIGAHSSRPLSAIDRPVLDLLRVGVAELVRGDRPIPLTVDAVVGAAKRLNPTTTGFVNAVLRSVSRVRPSLKSEIPGWLAAELSGAMDNDEIEAFWTASHVIPEVGLWSSDPLPEARPVEGISSAWLHRGAVPRDSHVQDPASIAVGNAVDAKPGERILDMAAAPGGKTRQLVASGAWVVAADRHPRRVRDARKRVPDAHWVVADGRHLAYAKASFDAVLVDAPCTGFGTLRRRPEIMHRMTASDVTRMATTGRALIESAIELVKPGGRVIYSVCTVTPTESIDVVAGLGATQPLKGLPGRPYGDGWLLAPHLGPTDGMFIARIDV